MKNEDAQLVNRCLSGDENAFTLLVKKHQKNIHALTWRKVGDFHIAEELTQDTFLKAYQKLATLKNPNQFAGWLYVIADRLCITWHRKQKLPMESLETTNGEEIEESSYQHYENERREEASAEYRRGYIKHLLEKLPESERTVATLHYLGEMTCKAIGEFLGVSPNTVKSRLQRARNRLKEQENMIRETLGSVKLPANFTESIMRQIADIKPIAPSSSKPIVPWAVSAATTILIFLIIGAGSQHLIRFQKPYNLNAQSEATVEIIDAPIVLDTQAKRDLRNQAGRFDATGKNIGTGPQVSEPVLFAAAEVETEESTATKLQWRQANGPAGVSILGLLASSNGDIYATSPIGIYRLAPNAAAWTLVNATATNGQLYPMPMAERGNTLYTVSTKELLASTDRGETWNPLGSRPKGRAIGLIITDQAFYLAIAKKGVFRSTDAGKQWTAFNDGFNFDEESTDEKIAEVAAIGNTVFALTDRGPYRLDSDRWEKLKVPTEIPAASNIFDSLRASESDLYVVVNRDLLKMKTEFTELSQEKAGKAALELITGRKINWEIFHSTDLGNSWSDITPDNIPISMRIASGIKLMAAGGTVLALGGARSGIRSKDRGQTWSTLREIPYTPGYTPDAAVNGNTFYAGTYRIHRTTDGGESWQPFMNGVVGTKMRNLVAFKNALYVHNDGKIVKSTDGGESWIPLNFGKGVGAPHDPNFPNQRLVVADGVLYGVFREKLSGIFSSVKRKSKLRIFHLSDDGNTLKPVKGVPSLEFDDARYTDDLLAGEVTLGRLAVSDETFYIEYRRELFKCKSGTRKWSSTGLIDSGEQPPNSRKGVRLAVSGETLYVGKRDGKLFQSLDGGDNWKDITPNLPLSFTRFKEIIFVDSAIYVSTDKGVLTSQTGEHWRVITDIEGERLIVAGLAVDDTTVYGVCNTGAYRLDNRGTWKKVSPEVPDGIRELVFANDKLYIITNRRGMFHISLKNEVG